jgi:hypothetical protein
VSPPRAEQGPHRSRRRSIDVSYNDLATLKYFGCARRYLSSKEIEAAMKFDTCKSVLSVFAAAALVCAAPAARAQEGTATPAHGATPGSSAAAGADTSELQHESEQNPEAARAANDDMSMPGMNMGENPHMFMTQLQPKKPGDDRRAEEIVEILAKSIAKYKDYKVAIADGYQIFGAKVQQPVYHFTNYHNAMTAAFIFNPAHPTSLLYKKTGEGYELVGAMYTAPKNATESQLNERVPLSIARWHEHVNFCLPGRGTALGQVDWKKYLAISTQDACAQVNGRWMKQIFGWMVHVYPFESDPDKVWAH